jgi:excisionase family DNA binding protein
MKDGLSSETRTGYLRWDRVLPLLRQRLGIGATRPEMAKHLGIGYVTFWRVSTGKGDTQHLASEQVVDKVLAAFPDHTFDDLFVAEDRPRRGRPAKTPTQPERLYTVDEIAATWSCSKNLIYNLIRDRKLDAVNIGIGRAKMRIPASAINAYIAATTKAKTNVA